MPPAEMKKGIETLLAFKEANSVKNLPVLGGWPQPPQDGAVRLYMNLALSLWVDIPEKAILFRHQVAEGTSEALWVDPKAKLTFHYDATGWKGTQTATDFLDHLEKDDDGGYTHIATHTRWPYCR